MSGVSWFVSFAQHKCVMQLKGAVLSTLPLFTVARTIYMLNALHVFLLGTPCCSYAQCITLSRDMNCQICIVQGTCLATTGGLQLLLLGRVGITTTMLSNSQLVTGWISGRWTSRGWSYLLFTKLVLLPM